LGFENVRDLRRKLNRHLLEDKVAKRPRGKPKPRDFGKMRSDNVRMSNVNGVKSPSLNSQGFLRKTGTKYKKRVNHVELAGV